MDGFKKEFIGILKAAFSVEAVEISSEFDWEKAVDLAKKHNIVPILYYGAVNCKVPKDEKHMKELYALTLRSITVSMRQTYEIEQVQKAFDEAGVEYMPLKGIILKEVYPQPEMRTMGDADILIKLEQYPLIQSIMEKLNFSFQYESDHELVWKKPTLFLELHKSIMTTYNKDFYRYFETGWKIAKRIPDSSKYEMSAEDFYIFAFVHFTKHYRISGIGIKHLVDLWVYSKAHPEIDWTYVEKELEKMQLSEFFENIKKTIDVWFGDAADTEITDLITNVILNSGQYGSAEMAIVNRALQKGKKSTAKIKLERTYKGLFLPLEEMQKRYEILCRVPLLLPVMWLVRFFELLFFKKNRLKKHFDTLKQLDEEKLNENRQALEVVGLSFEPVE